MADEDVGGIKVGLTADMTQLSAALDEADRLISGKAQKLRDRQITMNVFAKVDNATFGKIERDLNTVVKRAQENNAFKFRPKLEMTRGGVAQFNRDMIKQARQAGGFKIPVVPEFDPKAIAAAVEGQEIAIGVKGEWQGWLGNTIPEVVVKVRGSWDGWDDQGPPEVAPSGDGPRRSGPSSGARRQSRTNVQEPPPPSSHAKSEAEATGKAVADKLKEQPVKTEKAAKEKTEEKAEKAAAPVKRVEVAAPPEAAAASVAATPKSAQQIARDIQRNAAAQAKELQDRAQVAASNMEQSFLRQTEVPAAAPVPETTGDQAVCPFCHQVFTKRGLTQHINRAHRSKEGQTPGGYSREELTRAQTTSGIGRVTPESTLMRRMFEERRDIGEVAMTPDEERLFGTEVIRDKRPVTNALGERMREGGLLEKGLDYDALQLGYLRPIEGLSEEKTKALLEDPDYLALQDDLTQAIEARRDHLKSEYAEELERVRHNADRPDTYLTMLREAIEDPTAGIAGEVGARRARRARRAELGVSEEALSGFRMRDVLAAATPGVETEVPEGYAEAIKAYAAGEAAGREADVQQQAELDKSLLRHRSGEPGARQWNFGPDINLLRDLRTEALSGEEADLGKLEEVRRLAFGPQPGEDIDQFPEGDPRRTGLLPRIRRAAVRGARNEGAKQGVLARFGRLFSDRNPLNKLRPREMEAMEVASIGAEAAAILDIEDVRRNQEQSSAQAAATREANVGTLKPGTKRQTKVRGVPDKVSVPEIVPFEGRIQASAAEIRQSEDKKRREEEAINRVRLAEQAKATPPPEPEAETILDISEIAPVSLTEEDRANLQILEETKPATCPCGWTGSQGQFDFHKRGNRHKNWQQTMQRAQGPSAGAGLSGPYNPEVAVPQQMQEAVLSDITGVSAPPMVAARGYERAGYSPPHLSQDAAREEARAEALRLSEAEQASAVDVSVAGQEGVTPQATTRWCEVCRRPIASRQWKRHIAGREHRANMERVNQKIRADYEDQGLQPPPDLEEMNRAQVEDAIKVPPPAFAAAMSREGEQDLSALSSKDVRDLSKIAQTAGGRRSLIGAGFTTEQVEQLQQGMSARATGGEEEAQPPGFQRKRPITMAQTRNILGADVARDISESVSDESRELLDQSRKIKLDAGAMLKENPVRALSVTIGQIAVQTIGGRASLERRIKDVDKASTDYNRLVKKADRAITERNQTEAALAQAFEEGDTESVEKLQESLQARKAIADDAVRVRDEQRQVLDKAGETAMFGRGRMMAATVGIGTLGIVAGTALFQTAMTAFNTVMEQGAAWVGRVTDEMTGFANQTNKLAKELATASMQTGRIEGNIRQRMGMSGIGGDQADALAEAIAPRITGEVASQRSELMRDTLMLGLQGLMDRARQPDIENFRGVWQPTGGMVLPIIGQTNIGAQASVQEQIARMVGDMPSNTLFDWINADARAPREFFAPLGDFFGMNTSGMLKAQDEGVRMVMGTLSDAIERGGGTARFVNPTTQIDQRNLLAEQAQATMLDMMGAAPDLTNRIRSGDIALVDANGKVITSQKQLSAAFDDLARGMQQVDIEQILKAGARQLEGALFGIAMNLRNQLRTWNPIQTAMQYAQQPLARFGTGVQTNLVDPTFLAQRQGISQGIRQQIGLREMAGIVNLTQQAAQMPTIGRSPADLLNTYAQIRRLGQDIVGWQQQIADMQIYQGIREYSRQVFVAQRNIGDLRGLVHGAADAEASWLGIVQKKQIARQREIQDIQRVGEAESLAMNQRQINFQRATSRFTAAGATGAEAAAQFRQAQLEADYAQRQQDRNMDIFRITGEMIPDERRIVDESNLRQLSDALAEFQLFQDRFELDQKTALIAQNISDAQAAQAFLAQDMQAMLGALQQVQSTQTSMIVDAFNNGSDTLQKTATEVRRVFNEVASDFARNFTITISGRRRSVGGTSNTTRGTGDNIGRYSTGFLGNVSSATSMVVGEAGTETVAVLRNPRKVSSGNGGGNIINVNINNPTVRNDQDVYAIARAVEEVLSRRTTLLGLRR